MNTQMTVYADGPGYTRKAWWTGRQVGTTYLRADRYNTALDLRAVAAYDIAVGDIVQLDPFQPFPNLAQDAAANATTIAGFNAAKGCGVCVGVPNIFNRTASQVAAFTSVGANGVWAPAAAIFGWPKLAVVTHVHPDVNRRLNSTDANPNFALQRAGGMIDICPMGFTDARVRRNSADLVAAELLSLFLPATSAASTNVFTIGAATNGDADKPAFHNLAAGDYTATITTAATTILDILNTQQRIHARAAESLTGAGTETGLRRVYLGGDFGC